MGSLEDGTASEWVNIYFIQQSEDEFKCNICDIIVVVNNKSSDLLSHIETSHKEVYELHKDNPQANIGFRIEFLHLDEDIDPKNEAVVLGEVCEQPTECESYEECESTEKEIMLKDKGTNVQYILMPSAQMKQKKKVKLTKVVKKDVSSEPRKRSWVWKYFVQLSSIIFRCNLCNAVLSIKGCNTNNMNRHVRSRHPSVFQTEVGLKSIEQHSDIMSETDTPLPVKTEVVPTDNVDSEISLYESPKPSRSWVWSYFTKLTSTLAQCKLCQRTICHGGNATGNMNRHLKMIHHKTAELMTYNKSWVWKVFEADGDDFYVCKICQQKTKKTNDCEANVKTILQHLKADHGIISGDQIITSMDCGSEN